MRNKEKVKFYYLGSDLNLHEVRRFYLKIASIICVTTLLAVGLIIGLNQMTVNFLGFGSNEAEALAGENAALRARVSAMTDIVSELRESLDRVEQQGDELRLMVDLPPVDDQVKEAGTGGSSIPELMSVSLSDGPGELSELGSLLSKMSGELKIQEQNYTQILNKYESNKAYFAALPALKPMRGAYSSNKFGMRMHPILGVMKRHTGLDIHGNVGTEVVASGDGIVTMAGHSGGGYGNIVVINHGYGYQTLYAHLSKVLVRRGKKVRRGDPIARSGKSGLVSGPHLHYEVRRNGVSLDPTDFFYDDITAEAVRNRVAGKP
jgi:murein DD-endopeptidase MepM/ murein hydrolase activator NlpD